MTHTSKCCGAKVKVAGTTILEGTHYYVCTKCDKPCDIQEPIQEGKCNCGLNGAESDIGHFKGCPALPSPSSESWEIGLADKLGYGVSQIRNGVQQLDETQYGIVKDFIKNTIIPAEVERERQKAGDLIKRIIQSINNELPEWQFKEEEKVRDFLSQWFVDIDFTH